MMYTMFDLCGMTFPLGLLVRVQFLLQKLMGHERSSALKIIFGGH